MSYWTHIAGIIRFDALMEIPTVQDLEKHLGNQIKNWESTKEWQECNIPQGSEGSIRYQILDVNPPERGRNTEEYTCFHASRYVVTIWADLRDFHTPNQIQSVRDWWEKNYNRNKR